MKDLLKLIACWVAFIAAQMFGGVVGGLLHLQFPPFPVTTSSQTLILAQFASAGILAIGLYPLAKGLAAPAAVRILALGGFYFAALGVNGVIETRFFTHMMDTGVPAMELIYVLQLCSAAPLAGCLARKESPRGWLATAGQAGREEELWHGWDGR
jgi:hypothetical protein